MRGIAIVDESKRRLFYRHAAAMCVGRRWGVCEGVQETCRYAMVRQLRNLTFDWPMGSVSHGTWISKRSSKPRTDVCSPHADAVISRLFAISTHQSAISKSPPFQSLPWEVEIMALSAYTPSKCLYCMLLRNIDHVARSSITFDTRLRRKPQVPRGHSMTA